MDILQEIWSGMKHNKLRTLLTGLSVSWGIFILIVLLGAGNGLKNGVTSNFSDRATNTVQTWPGRTTMPYQGLQSGRNLHFSEKELQQVDRSIQEKTDQTAIYEMNTNFTYNTEYGNYSVKGIEPVYGQIFNLKVTKGRFINDYDVESKRKVIVIDQKIEEVLFKKESALGKFVKVGDVMFQIIGVNTKKERWGSPSAYIPFTTSLMIYNPGKKFYSMAMTVQGLETEQENEGFNDKLKTTLSKTMFFNPKDPQALWIFNSQRNYIETMKIFNGITLFVSIIGIFTLIAGIVGVSNIMLVTVKERTREIGIRKALGAQPAQILFSVIVESILLTSVFGYIGMMTGIGLTELISMIMAQSAAANPSETGMQVFMNPTVDLTYVFISTVILIIAGVIAGYMPARKAVRIKPIEAMREE